ncbi:MAG: hypothetical protein R3D51_17905 [Hyphomicrobiaceae bacterium]
MSANDRAVISRELSELGYGEVRRYEYKGDWSNDDVYHKLRLVEAPFAGGVVDNVLSYRFWFGNPGADHFCATCVRKYGPPAFSGFHFSPECPTVATFTGTRGSYELWYLDTAQYDAKGLAEALKLELQEAVLSRVRSITDLESLYAAAVGLVGDFPWYKVNALMRTALIIYLGVRQRRDPDEIAVAAIQASKGISWKAQNLPGRTEMEIIEGIWTDAEANA